MSASFTEIVVSRTAEQGFRRRAIARMPKEYMEVLYGRVRGSKLYIHAFMPIKHKGKPAELSYEDEDLEDHTDQAPDEKLESLGTAHSHPHCLDSAYSEQDLRDIQDKADIVMAICAITQEVKNGKTRRRCEIVYWPAPRPMKIVYAP
jgi:proteasome lid subunit RPN8/RPN11